MQPKGKAAPPNPWQGNTSNWRSQANSQDRLGQPPLYPVRWSAHLRCVAAWSRALAMTSAVGLRANEGRALASLPSRNEDRCRCITHNQHNTPASPLRFFMSVQPIVDRSAYRRGGHGLTATDGIQNRRGRFGPPWSPKVTHSGPRLLCIRPDGGRTWWAHFEFTRINTTPRYRHRPMVMHDLMRSQPAQP
jgi:hypothetical protein